MLASPPHLSHLPRGLLEPSHRPPPQGGLQRQLDDETREHEERVLRCRHCAAEICREADAVEVAGQHRHTFSNPAGILFEIGCFEQAAGCQVLGHPTAAFSWFAGHSWSTAICTGCQQHLGWRFEGAAGSVFFGLILKHLRSG